MPKLKRAAIGVVVLFVVLFVGAVGCTHSNPANAKDQRTSSTALAQLDASQPVQTYTWSQQRQSLIEIERAKATTTLTTTFFFNQGVQDPIQSCPSIGFPVASTEQLTNPSQIVWDQGSGSGGNVAIPQIDPTGTYTGNSSGTYVMCSTPSGQAYADYWEGFVQTVTGPAVWDSAAHAVKLTGTPTGAFTAGKR